MIIKRASNWGKGQESNSFQGWWGCLWVLHIILKFWKLSEIFWCLCFIIWRINVDDQELKIKTGSSAHECLHFKFYSLLLDFCFFFLTFEFFFKFIFHVVHFFAWEIFRK
jgi:hypothetical protein